MCPGQVDWYLGDQLSGTGLDRYFGDWLSTSLVITCSRDLQVASNTFWQHWECGKAGNLTTPCLVKLLSQYRKSSVIRILNRSNTVKNSLAVNHLPLPRLQRRTTCILLFGRNHNVLSFEILGTIYRCSRITVCLVDDRSQSN